MQLLDNEFISQNIWQPTFKQANGVCKNVLDYILTDVPDRVSNIVIGEPLGNADQAHLGIVWDTKLNTTAKKSFPPKKYAYKRGDYVKMNDSLEKTDWKNIFSNKDTEQWYEAYLNEYNRNCELFIPKMNVKNHKQRAPWLNKDILRLSALKKKLWHQNQSTKWKIATLDKEYHTIRKEIKKETKKAVSSFEQTLANDKKNPKLLHAYVNSRQKTRDSINAIRKSDKSVNNCKKEIASALNGQLSSVFVKEPVNDRMPDFNSRTNNKLNDFNIIKTTVAKLLVNLDRFKSCGTDNVHSFVLKSCASFWSEPLSIILQKSLDAGEVPKAWREANITPLYKKRVVDSN